VAGFVVAPSPATAGQPVGFSPLGSFDPDGSLGSFNWDFGDGTSSSSVFPVHVFAAAGTYSVTLTVTDADGATARTTQALQVNPAPAPPPLPAPSKTPVLSSAHLFPTSFAAAGKGGSLTRARPTGTNIRYRDSQNATTAFAVLHPTIGHRSGRRCVGGRPRHGQRRCTVLVTKGSFSHRDRAGNVRVHFTGRVRGRKLPPGSYGLTLTPKANGKTGRAVRLAFRVRG
jgi:PKD domain